MSSTLFPQLTDPMPRWQYTQTLHLTEEAVNNPRLLLKDFFACYSLPDIRYCLHEWLEKSIRQDEVFDANLLALHDNMLKLVEASWLLWKEKQGGGCKGKGRREKTGDGSVYTGKKAKGKLRGAETKSKKREDGKPKKTGDWKREIRKNRTGNT